MTTPAYNEGELMRTCGHLYASIALESLATTLMSMVFGYLLLLITNKGRLQNPGRAAFRLVWSKVNAFYREVSSEVSHWPEMNKLPLDRRFAMCRKTNQTICTFQILIGFLTVERWLHINNVNGFRYLGYSMTCPPMQTQLLVLIAPAVPCYKFNCIVTYFLTMAMLLLGYAASVIPGDLYTGSIETFFSTWKLDDLGPTLKFWPTVASGGIQVWLTVVQIPLLWLLYVCKGGVKGGLPYGYTRMLLIVAISWLAFPLWWALSFEGMSLITDTKLNAIGFALLNVIAKGSFTLQMLRMTKWHRNQKKREEWLAKGRRLSKCSDSNLFKDEMPTEVDPQPSLKHSETWIVSILRPYDAKEQSPVKDWEQLELPHRAFLMGRGVSPDSWKSMPPEERAFLQEEWEKTLDSVIGMNSENDRHPAEMMNLWVKQQQQAVGSPASKVEGSMRQVEPSPRPVEAADDKARIAKTSEFEDMDDATTVEAGSSQLGGSCVSDSPLPPTKLRIGQTVTTVHGDKGKILKLIGKPPQQLQIAIGAKQARVVNIKDLSVLRVIFLGGRGLRNVPGINEVYCSCMVEGRTSSEVQTPSAPTGSRLSWEHEVDLHGYSAGNCVTVRLWGCDPHEKCEQLLGEAEVRGEDLSETGFEDEVQLCLDGKPLPMYLSLTIMALNTPGEEHGLDTGDVVPQLARPVSMIEISDKAADQKSVCCFMGMGDPHCGRSDASVLR